MAFSNYHYSTLFSQNNRPFHHLGAISMQGMSLVGDAIVAITSRHQTVYRVTAMTAVESQPVPVQKLID